jgi:hypothetical protein
VVHGRGRPPRRGRARLGVHAAIDHVPAFRLPCVWSLLVSHKRL